MEHKATCASEEKDAKENAVRKKTPPQSDTELDVTNEKFDPLRALYAMEYKISKKNPKVQYQNLAAFESAVKKFGIWNLNKSSKPKGQSNQSKSEDTPDAEQPSGSSNTRLKPAEEPEDGLYRRFLPHQMPVRRERTRKAKHQRNFFTQMAAATGPLALLQKYVTEKQRVRVVMRREHGVRGHIDGVLVCFDKYWNLLLSNVTEVWRRRKIKYGENKICDEPVDCSSLLLELGIELPAQQVKSLNRKNVEIRRCLPQLLVRGEQVVLVTASQ